VSVILFDKPPPVQRVCSFCKKAEHQVKRMISNDMPDDQERNICNECVEKATKLIKEES
jgi:ATP-dependent protease Clp ATPase subunit